MYLMSRVLSKSCIGSYELEAFGDVRVYKTLRSFRHKSWLEAGLRASREGTVGPTHYGIKVKRNPRETISSAMTARGLEL